MDQKFIDKIEDIKSFIHEDLIKWGQFKRNGVPDLYERMPFKGTSLLIIDNDKSIVNMSSENKISLYISDEIEDTNLLNNYNQYIDYLSAEEKAIIKSHYFRKQTLKAMELEFCKSREYLKERIENSIIKIAYQNPAVDFLDIDYDLFQAYKCEKLTLTYRWKNTLLRSISFERDFYTTRIKMLPSIMQEKLNKRLQKECLDKNERKLENIALLFIAYSLPKEHPMHISLEQMQEEYYEFMKTDRYLNQFMKSYRERKLETSDISIHMIVKNNHCKQVLHFNNKNQMLDFLDKNPALKGLYTQNYITK